MTQWPRPKTRSRSGYPVAGADQLMVSGELGDETGRLVANWASETPS